MTSRAAERNRSLTREVACRRLDISTTVFAGGRGECGVGWPVSSLEPSPTSSAATAASTPASKCASSNPRRSTTSSRTSAPAPAASASATSPWSSEASCSTRSASRNSSSSSHPHNPSANASPCPSRRSHTRLRGQPRRHLHTNPPRRRPHRCRHHTQHRSRNRRPRSDHPARARRRRCRPPPNPTRQRSRPPRSHDQTHPATHHQTRGAHTPLQPRHGHSSSVHRPSGTEYTNLSLPDGRALARVRGSPLGPDAKKDSLAPVPQMNEAIVAPRPSRLTRRTAASPVVLPVAAVCC